MDCDAGFGAPAAGAGVTPDPAAALGCALVVPVFAALAVEPPFGAAMPAAAAEDTALFAASISASVSIASGKSIAAGFAARSNSLLNAPNPNCEASMR